MATTNSAIFKDGQGRKWHLFHDVSGHRFRLEIVDWNSQMILDLPTGFIEKLSEADLKRWIEEERR